MLIFFFAVHDEDEMPLARQEVVFFPSSLTNASCCQVLGATGIKELTCGSHGKSLSRKGIGIYGFG